MRLNINIKKSLILMLPLLSLGGCVTSPLITVDGNPDDYILPPSPRPEPRPRPRPKPTPAPTPAPTPTPAPAPDSWECTISAPGDIYTASGPTKAIAKSKVIQECKAGNHGEGFHCRQVDCSNQ